MAATDNSLSNTASRLPFQIPEKLIHSLRQAQKITALTGAGISAESGIPTFREAQSGLWARYNPEDLATPQAFERDPDLVWRWYDWRRKLIASTRPNPGHLALAALEQKVAQFALITQNVDGLHAAAGSQSIIELHGNIFRFYCNRCRRPAPASAAQAQSPPQCAYCRGMIRPDVVWFGEQLDASRLDAAVKAAKSCDFFLLIGTSGFVQPAASFPYLASKAGATLIEINPAASAVSTIVEHVLRGPAGEVLPGLVQTVWPA